MRWHAVVALGDVGEPRGCAALAKRLEDPVCFVRGHASIALAQIGDAAYLGAVERAAASEAHEKMRGVIAAAARLLKAQPREGGRA